MKLILFSYDIKTDKWNLNGLEGRKELSDEECKYFRAITFGQRQATPWAVRYFVLNRKLSLFNRLRINLSTFIIGDLNR